MKRFSSTFWILLLLLSMVAFAPQAQATSWDPSITTRPVNNQGQMGDALLGSFFRSTISDINFMTYISVENTTNRWVAAHLRLRSGRYSIEILDFPILLSPHDVFWFQFDPDPDGNGVLDRLALWTTDSKTVGYSDLLNLTPGWREVTTPFPRYEIDLRGDLMLQFTKLGFEPDSTELLEEMTMGYIEAFGLFSAGSNGGSTFLPIMRQLYANRNGAPQASPLVEGMINTFKVGSTVYAATDVTKALSGHVFNGDFTNGLYTGYTMEAINNFRDGNVSEATVANQHRDTFARSQTADTGGVIVYNVDGPDGAYSDPDWATTFGPTWNDGDNVFGPMVAPIAKYSSWSIDEVDDALAKRLATSTYFNSGFTGVTFTTALVTYPTKYLHVFFNYASGLPASGDVWPVGNAAASDDLRDRMDVAAKVGKVYFGGQIWDLEEGTCGFGVSPTSFDPFPWEVNCMPIGAATKRNTAVQAFCNMLSFDGNDPFDVEPGVGASCGLADFFAGKFAIQDFTMIAGATFNDPRNSTNASGDPSYVRANAPLLNALTLTTSTVTGGGINDLIPAVIQIIDWDFTGQPRSRAYYPAWDNPGTNLTEPVL